MKAEFFKDYKVIAGHGGLDNQIQGVTVLDAPDGFKWTMGKEFVITSGYIFSSDFNYLNEYICSDELRKNAALGIKFVRYLKRTPENLIEACNKCNVPLIDIPDKDPFMGIFNAVNVIVMNKNIRQFNIGRINPKSFTDLTYQEMKIKKILNSLEYEMEFPAMLYDLIDDKAYYSSNKFKELSVGFSKYDYWDPSFSHSVEVMCDNLKMIRYRFYDDKYDKPYSWITVPISVKNKVRAYFVVMEATELLDYFDQFALRIGFVQIQAMFEQILVAQSSGDRGFASVVKNIINKRYDKKEIIEKALEYDLDVDRKSCMFVIEQKNKGILISGYSDIINSDKRQVFGLNTCQMALMGDNRCLFMYNFSEREKTDKEYEAMLNKVCNLKKRLELDIEGSEFIIGISDVSDYIFNAGRNYDRCLKSICMGSHIYPGLDIIEYSRLGVFAWVDIKEDEIDVMKKGIEVLYTDEANSELLETLKVYLENKMNFSLTAEKLFVHINTVRKRIEKIGDMISVDLNDEMNRIKLELLLKII